MLLEDVASKFGRRRFTLFTHLVIVLVFFILLFLFSETRRF